MFKLYFVKGNGYKAIKKTCLTQKPVRIGMITARQRVGLRIGTKKKLKN